MKKLVLVLAMLAFFIESPAQHAHKSNKTTAAKDTVAMYHCPMKCSNDKHFAKEGKCEVCGMKLMKDEALMKKK